MGVSDPHYFAWLARALGRFERESGAFGAVGAGRDVTLCVLAGARMNPALELMRDALGRERTTLRWLDRFERWPAVEPVDMNALDVVAGASCDVLVMTRASYMVEDPKAFLRDTRRILRPGGLMVIDWLHGAAEVPRLDLPGYHEYEGHRYPFLTTYADARSLDEGAEAFEAFIRHVNRPPAWVDVERPGRPVPIGRRLRKALAPGPRGGLTRATYLEQLDAALGRAGKHLVQPGTLGEHFEVIFRDARYLYPLTRKFHLHLLTVLRPVRT